MSAKILLIEPHPLLADSYKQALETAGFDVVWVRGAQAAVDAADTHQPNLVIMELRLAGHDGIEFLHEFRSYPEWQNVPAIIITHTPPHTVQPLAAELNAQLGVRHILYKPKTSLAKLLRTVRETLEGV